MDLPAPKRKYLEQAFTTPNHNGNLYNQENDKPVDDKRMVGEKIYWDPDTKNKKGKSPTCITYHCYQAQGGADISEESPSGKEDLTFVVTKETSAFEYKVKTVEQILDTLIFRAHKKTSELYPNLDKKSNTFGMIRNAFIDHYIKIYTNVT